MLPDGRPFSYRADIESALDFQAFTLDETHLSRLRTALRAGNRPAAEIIFTLDEQGRAVSRAGRPESPAAAPDGTNLQYLTHRYAEWVQNPFLARAMAQQHLNRLEAELGREAVAAHFSRLTALLVDFLRAYKSERGEAVLRALPGG